MKTKILYLAWSIYRDIVFSGIVEDISQDQRRKITRFNQFASLALLINFFCVIIYFYNRLYISALINITSACFFLVAFYLNSRNKLEIARIVSIVNVNLYLIVISYVEGLRAAEYLLFFPYFLILTFVVSIRTNYRELLLVFTISVLSLLLCFRISPITNDIQIMTDAVYTRLSGTILALSFFLTIIFSYAILRLKKGNEEAILEEKKFGDTIFNTSLDGVFIIYSGSNIVASCNKRALELFGLNDKCEVEGTQIESWFSEDHIRKFTSINQMLSGEPRNWQGELAFNTKKGLIFFAYVSVVPLAYKDTSYTKISILDISNVKMAEFELMKAKEKGRR